MPKLDESSGITCLQFVFEITFYGQLLHCVVLLALLDPFARP